MSYYIGVDVGSGSVRSALIDDSGHLVTVSTQDTQIWSPKADYYEQSSENIWSCVVHTIKEILSASGVEKEKIKGIGFDGTCSLVTVGKNGTPLTVSPSGKPECNIIMWMDHRAVHQENKINATQHPVLKFTGGQISVEMEPPKLLWIKENKPETWKKAEHFFELPDFLTWKATGCLTRSRCSLVCKWTYHADDKGNCGWNDEFWEAIGLKEFTEEKYQRCGNDVRCPGEVCGQGLTNEAAEQLGLIPNTPVGVSIIDAHAGVLGCVGCLADDEHFIMPDLSSRMIMICGTSTCHMVMRNEAIFVPGVWGPFYSSILPDMWTTEGGQSAVGKLVDFIVEKHPAYDKLKSLASERKVHIHTMLDERLAELQAKNNLPSLAQLTKNVHVWPDFHGNRSPLSDTSLCGMISGLTLSSDMDDLAVKYLATIQALAYGTRHILDEMVKRGHKIELNYMCGGLRKNKLYVKTHVDVTGIPAILPYEEESVLIGAAMLGASASKNFDTLQDSVKKMGGKGKLVKPDLKDNSYHNRKYKVFLKMVDDQREYASIMKE